MSGSNKMTENDIIKALEGCMMEDSSYCLQCPLNGKDYCRRELQKSVQTLLKRKKKENERLKKVTTYKLDDEQLHDIAQSVLSTIEYKIDVIKGDAIKEFVEELKDKHYYSQQIGALVVDIKDIDNLVKEMIGGGVKNE